MGRFGENNEFFEDDHDFDYDDDVEYGEDHDGLMAANIPAEMMDRWKRHEIGIDSKRINLTLLQQVISMLERSWIWRFRSLQNQVRMITDTYYAMNDLVVDVD